METPLPVMGDGHYHFSVKVLGRSQGHAACAAAAYRSGEKIYDAYYDQDHDYRARSGVYATEIRAPGHAPDWMKNRQDLWNSVERFETRKNSQLAREFEVSIPAELTPAQRQAAIRSFVDKELVSRGMVADIAYHDFTGRHAHNPHAHIMVTLREVKGSSFAAKKNRDWNREETLRGWREAWARHANQALEQAGSPTRIDHRSYKDRGIDKAPLHETQHEWQQRQKEIAAASRQQKALDARLAALEQEQARHQQERLDALIAFGNEQVRRRAAGNGKKPKGQEPPVNPLEQERRLQEQLRQLREIERERGPQR